MIRTPHTERNIFQLKAILSILINLTVNVLFSWSISIAFQQMRVTLIQSKYKLYFISHFCEYEWVFLSVMVGKPCIWVAFKYRDIWERCSQDGRWRWCEVRHCSQARWHWGWQYMTTLPHSHNNKAINQSAVKFN